MRWLALGALSVVSGACLGQSLTRNWVQTWSLAADSLETADEVAISPDQSVYVCARTRLTGGPAKTALIKYDTAGRLQWTAIYAGLPGQEDHLGHLAFDSASNVYLSGETGGLLGREATVLKFSPLGQLVWEAHFAGSSGDCLPKAVVGPDDLCVISRTFDRAFQLDKLDSDGNSLWHRSFQAPGSFDDRVGDVRADAVGNVYQAGLCQTDPNEAAALSTVTVKYAPDGTFQWFQAEGGPTGRAAGYPAIDARTQNVVVASAPESPSGAPVALTYPLDRSGNEVWRHTWPDDPQGDARPVGVRVDSVGNIFMAVQVTRPPDIFVVKYRPGGARIWVASFDAGLDSTVGMALDGRNNVAVVGLNGSGAPKAETAVFNATGNLLGSDLYKGPGFAWPASVAMDRIGRTYMLATVSPHGLALVQYKQVGQVGPQPGQTGQ